MIVNQVYLLVKLQMESTLWLRLFVIQKYVYKEKKD